MASSLHRSNPTSSVNLNASQPQISAPVLEYRCMFTHDLLKKQKKWHDGSLRFHTFNKRVMVYDDAKNFIGDLHYRQAEHFGEGLELKLDRPVLVQVEEPLGQTNTDLTPLLSRQNQDGSPSHSRNAQPSRAALSRTNATNSQIRPKSIKELLAGSQGTLGRARPIAQSPYEQRHPLAEIQTTVEPLAKKRKVLSENHCSPATSVERPQPQNIQPALVLQPDVPQRDSSPAIYTISSDDEPVLTNARPQSNKKSDQLKRSKKLKIATKETNSNSEVGNRGYSVVVKPNKDAVDDPGAYAVRRPISASSPVSRPSTSASGDSRYTSIPALKSSLKFAAQQSRPKLMYPAMLSSHSQITLQVKAARLRNASQDVSTRRRPEMTDLVDTDAHFALSQLRAGQPHAESSQIAEQILERVVYADEAVGKNCSPQQEPDSDDDMFADIGDPINPAPASPLFVSQSASQVSLYPSQYAVADDFALGTPSGEGESLDEVVAGDCSDGVIATTSVQASLGKGDTPSSPAFHVPQPVSILDTAEDVQLPPSPVVLDQVLLHDNHNTPETIHQHRPTKLARPFRRVVSENLALQDTVKHAEIQTPTDTDQDPDLSNIDMNDLSPLRVRKTPLKRPAMLRTSTSDPILLNGPVIGTSAPLMTAQDEGTSLAQRKLKPRPGTEAEEPAQELSEATPHAHRTGPWSTIEAYILFDQWPPGRPKPDFGQLSESENPFQRSRNKHNTDSRKEGTNRTESTSGMSKKYGMFASAKLVSQR